jgi:transposase
VRRTSSLSAAGRGRRGSCRSTRPTTAAAASSPRSSPTSTGEAWSRCSTAAADAGSSATLRSLPEGHREAIEVVSIDPYEAYRQAIQHELPRARIVVDHFHPVRGANTALDSVRRERQREAGRKRPKGARRSGQGASWRRDLYRARHRLLKARERLTERERRRLCAPFEHEPLIAEAWALKEAFRSIYRAPDRGEAELRLEQFLAAVERAQLPALHRLRRRRPALAL